MQQHRDCPLLVVDLTRRRSSWFTLRLTGSVLKCGRTREYSWQQGTNSLALWTDPWRCYGVTGTR